MNYVTFNYKDKKYKIPETDLIQYLVKEERVKDDEIEGMNRPLGNEYKIFWQRDPRWRNNRLGYGKTTIGSHGCFVTCLAMMVKKTPDVVNEILKREGAFYKDLIKSPQAARALNLKYYGRDYNINNMPSFTPTIKEVRMGKSQHFVLRIIENGTRYIVDPWTGKRDYINRYPFKSYRLFDL